MLLVCGGMLSLPVFASPDGKICEKKMAAAAVTKKHLLKNQSRLQPWKSMLGGPLETFIYRILH